jgi:hypothetical protein
VLAPNGVFRYILTHVTVTVTVTECVRREAHSGQGAGNNDSAVVLFCAGL